MPDLLLGREGELSMLGGELDAAAAGQGRTLVLIGEAGIGKTRLASAVDAAARERGFQAVWGRCHEGDGAPAYWPWVQAIRSAVAHQSGVAATALSAVLAELRSDESHVERDGGSSAHARFALFDRVTTALTAAARERPLLLVIDDLHWADAGSLRLLEFVAPEVSQTPLLIVGTIRDAEIDTRRELASTLSKVARCGRCINVAGLASPAVRGLLAERLRREPGDTLVADVVAVTGGNPFLVLEVGNALAGEAAPTTSGTVSSVPLTIGARELLRRRVHILPPASLTVLEAAAVMGNEFDADVVAAALAATDQAVLDAMNAAVRHRIVRQLPDTLRRYAFIHALVRETIYDNLSPALRVQLHGAIADALEASGATTDDRLPLLAHHAFQAAQAGDPAPAIRHQLAAGERALRLLAFEEAARCFERALSTPALQRDASTRLHAVIGLAEALHDGGELERSNALLREAVDLARLQQPARFAETVRRIADVRLETGTLDVELNALLEEALDRLGDEPTALRARLTARLAAGLLLQPGAQERRKALSDEATALARQLGDPACLEFVLSRRLVALLGPDTLDERIATTDEVLLRAPVGRPAELQALIFRVDDLAERGDRAGVDHALAVFERKASAFRHPFFVWAAACMHAALALLEGRFAEGEALAQHALQVGQKTQGLTAVLAYAQQLFLIRGWQARFAEIEPLLQASITDTAVVPAWRCGLADLYVLMGRRAEARREFDALAGEGFASIPRDAAWLTSMSLLAGACVRLGDRARASELYALMAPYADRVAGARPLVVLPNLIATHLGALATLLELWPEAERHFNDATVLAERMRGLPWQAELRYQRALMHLRRGISDDVEHGRALLDDAEAIAHPLGMQLLLDWIAELRAMPAQTARTVSRAVGDDSGGRRARLALVPRAAGPARPADPRRPTATSNSFRREGDLWTLVFEDRTTRLRHMVGLAQLAALLRQPGRSVHVADLIDAAYGTRRDTPGGAGRPAGDAGELLDPQARAEYESRLRALRSEHDEATQLNDRGRAERLAEEIEFLASELARAYGLSGRPRRAGSSTERARVAVARAVKYAIDKIADQDAALAEHLRLGVRTGTLCSYTPPSRDAVSWNL